MCYKNLFSKYSKGSEYTVVVSSLALWDITDLRKEFRARRTQEIPIIILGDIVVSVAVMGQFALVTSDKKRGSAVCLFLIKVRILFMLWIKGIYLLSNKQVNGFVIFNSLISKFCVSLNFCSVWMSLPFWRATSWEGSLSIQGRTEPVSQSSV